MTLSVRVGASPGTAAFGIGDVVTVGRGRATDVRVGHERVQGRWTVSKVHVEVAWDGSRWSTVNVSERTGLLAVYEPGFEEVPLEPGRRWAPVRHRWSYALGRPSHRFGVVCGTDDHGVPPVGPDRSIDTFSGPDDGGLDDATASLESIAAIALTDLERSVVTAYYADFVALPRPATLAPRAHDDAAHRLGRSRDSTRKAIERVNDKIARAPDAPAIASGRNVSAEIGRWLARTGLLDHR